jgi:hypothetical protein
MKTRLYKLLAYIGLCLQRKFGGPSTTVHIDPALVALAVPVVAAVGADLPEAASENKHARAFARLRRVAPHATKRDVAMAIELALRG